ncbi:uncharacterized protein [Anabrus simplex]|uniref:uncharacterized protein n=1 Tax=Anabrus simplex TaxID=316456 RepID=UPI0035A34E9D
MKAIVEKADETSQLHEQSSFISEDSHVHEPPAEKFISCPFKNVDYTTSSTLSFHGRVYSSPSSQDKAIKGTSYSDSSRNELKNHISMSTEANDQHQQNENKNTPSLSTSPTTSTATESHQNNDESPAGSSGTEHQYSDITNFLIGQDLLAVKTVLPEYLQLLETGESLGDSKVSMDSVPDWLDLEKYKRGQKFALDYFFGLVFAEMLSLMLLFLYPENLKPLIYTGKSDTPFKAFKRYLSTVIRVKSWYESDIWKENSEARRNLKIVRDIHETYRKRINSLDPQAFEKKCTLKPPVWSELSDQLREDFRALCPYQETGLCSNTSKDKFLYINQADMAVTQFGFVGLMVLYPSAFGAGGASEEDLEGFVHLWRCIGYMLGIEDRYNFCTGDLATVRQRSSDFLEYKMKPKLRDVDHNWEHMYRCVVEGISFYVPGVTFEVSLLYLCRLLNIQSPHVEASLTYFQGFMYRFTSLVMCYLLRFPPYRALSNWLLRSSIKRATAPSPMWIREHEERVYPYQAQGSGSLCAQL